MSDPIIDEIKSKLDIVDIIGQYLTLKKSGANYKANCPFHGESTPSFMVNRERQLFRCFGCGESGDIFAFIMKQENIDFPTALTLLAERAGITLPQKSYSPPKAPGAPQKADLYAVNATAAKFFHQVLVSHPSGKVALDYLIKRGVTPESIAQFQIGFAPNIQEPLKALFAKQNYTVQAIRTAGSPDRFRDRIMFPFRDVIGNIVGFSGRALNDQQPKYLNTSQTELFYKNKYLYGLYEAKKHIGTNKQAILVEGQLDLVMAHQAGTPYTIATSGTALTEDHLKIIRRYTDTLYLALDTDDAGQKATLKAIQMALHHDFVTMIIPLPPNSDPGEVIATNKETWLQAVKTPKPAIEWLFSYYFPNTTKPTPTERQEIYAVLFPYISLQQDPVSQSYTFQHLALSLGIQDVDGVRKAFTEWERTKQHKKPGAPSEEPQPIEPSKPTELVAKERSLVGLLLLRPILLEYKEFHLREADFATPSLAHLYKLVLNWYNKATDPSSNTQLITYLETQLDNKSKQALQKLLFDVQTYVADFSPEQFLHEYSLLVQTVRKRLREERIQSFAQQIAQAEASSDRAKVLALMKQMQDTVKQKDG